MLSPSDDVSEVIMFSGCPSAAFVSSSGQILLPRHLMNAWNNFDKTDQEYSLSHADDLIRFWRLEVKGQGNSRPLR